MTMTVSVTHILPLAQIRRARMLPGKGRVVARVGQKVNATDLVAESAAPGQHVLIDVRRALGLRRVDETHRRIERQVGEKVQKGDILAQTKGILPRVIRATSDGTIVAISRGQILIEMTGAVYELKAGISGTVTEVLPERGVIVEANGALIQGMWGNQAINAGLMISLAKTSDFELTRSNLDVTMRGGIVLAGTCRSVDALQAAAELPLRGLILGSMASDLMIQAEKMPYPIILLEGFGKMPINSSAFKLLTTNDKREISMNAGFDPIHGEKPEIVIPLPANGQTPKDTTELKPGQLVRITCHPYASMVGSLSRLLPGLTNMPNGQRIAAAEVRLEDNQMVLIPLVNLDVLE